MHPTKIQNMAVPSGLCYLLIVVLVFGTAFGQQQTRENDEENDVKLISGKVTRVIDGDTIQFCPKVDKDCADNEIIMVDLWGVDAPELGSKKQFHAEEARTYLEKLVSDETVILDVVSENGTNLQFVKVFIVNHPQSNLNLHLLMEGKGWSTVPDESDTQEYTLAEEFARNQRKGLWREIDPIEPWIWRDQERETEDQESSSD